jgi:hypothetical protein
VRLIIVDAPVERGVSEESCPSPTKKRRGIANLSVALTTSFTQNPGNADESQSGAGISEVDLAVRTHGKPDRRLNSCHARSRKTLEIRVSGDVASFGIEDS